MPTVMGDWGGLVNAQDQAASDRHQAEEARHDERIEVKTAETDAGPPEAWDAIAGGYDRYVAPQEAELANEALRLVGLGARRGTIFLDVVAGTGGLSLPAGIWSRRWSPPTGRRR